MYIQRQQNPWGRGAEAPPKLHYDVYSTGGTCKCEYVNGKIIACQRTLHLMKHLPWRRSSTSPYLKFSSAGLLLYPVLGHYIVHKPVLELRDIPLFYTLLHSSSTQVETCKILCLLPLSTPPSSPPSSPISASIVWSVAGC